MKIILLSKGEDGVVVGAFVGLLNDDQSLDTVELTGYAGPNGSTVELDFACVFAP